MLGYKTDPEFIASGNMILMLFYDETYIMSQTNPVEEKTPHLQVFCSI